VDNLQATGGAKDTRWQGLLGKDLDVVIDLGAPRTLRGVTAGFYHNSVELIFLPASIDLFVSEDGMTFRSAGSILNAFPMTTDRHERREFTIAPAGTSGRYVRLRARNAGPAGAWHKLAGQPSWMYVDEIVVE
jgi:hexosaminidase